MKSFKEFNSVNERDDGVHIEPSAFKNVKDVLKIMKEAEYLQEDDIMDILVKVDVVNDKSTFEIIGRESAEIVYKSSEFSIEVPFTYEDNGDRDRGIIAYQFSKKRWVWGSVN